MINRMMLAFIFCSILSFISAEELKYFSNFKPGNMVLGKESLMTDYVTIANDPISNLPDKFTICTSLFIDVMTTDKSIVQIYKEDGTHWFQIALNVLRVLTSRTKKISLYLYQNQTGMYFRISQNPNQ